MRYFTDRLYPIPIPDVIDDLIFQFTYNRTRHEVHHRCFIAKQSTALMPTPRAWKHFLINGRFSFRRFLNGDNIIDLDAVRESLNCLNWHVLKAKRSPIARFTLITTKRALERGITNPYNSDNTVLMIWLLLANSTMSDFKSRAFRSGMYEHYCRVPMFTHPLSKYYPPAYEDDGKFRVLHFLLDMNIARA